MLPTLPFSVMFPPVLKAWMCKIFCSIRPLSLVLWHTDGESGLDVSREAVSFIIGTPPSKDCSFVPHLVFVGIHGGHTITQNNTI